MRLFSANLSLLHDILDLGVLILQVGVGLHHVGVATLVLVVTSPETNHVRISEHFGT